MVGTGKDFAKYVLVRGENFYESDRKSDINLKISLDGFIHYETDSVTEVRNNGTYLILDDYVGDLAVPNNSGLIIESDKDIKGIIGSPAAIYGKGDLNIEVIKNRDLEVCIDTKGIVFLNGIINYNGSDAEITNKYTGTIGGKFRGFSNFKKKYLKDEWSKQLYAPEIYVDTKIISASFKKSEFVYQDIHVCLNQNLINIKKTVGDINLFYESPIHKFSDWKIVDRRKHLILEYRRLESEN